MNVLIRILLVLNIFYPALGVRTNRRPRINPNRFVPCPVPTINNGTVRMQRLGRVGFFHCFEGFELHGQTNNPCQSGRWKQEIPICIKPGCARPQQNVPNGWVLVDPSRQKTTLFCHDGFINAGSTTAFCNGKNWDRQLGDCREDREHTKMCDFETSTLCGWTNDPDNNFAWVRRNGWNSFEKLESGPRHDHTVGKPLEGHYIVAEATNFRSIHKSRLLSPIYNQSESVDACFRFFYHMYGANVGRLRILIKTFSDQLNDIADNPQNILFEMKESQGNQWHEKTIEIESVHDDFQIVFEATGGNGVISDIAIDDVTLLKDGECIKYLPKVEKVTEESGGIYSYQSCTNRCSETKSVFVAGNETFGENGHITERCDCHQDCMDQNTCCPDYQSKCLESETESSVSTPDDDSTETNVVVTDKVTEKLPGIASNSSSVTVISTSTLIPTTASTIQSSVSTSTAIPITNATTVTSTSTLKPTTIPKPIPTVSQATNPTKRIDDISTKSTASGSSNRTKTLVISTNVPKMPNETLITSKTTNITMKAVETATKSTKIMSTVPKMTTISMNGVWKSSSTLKPTIAVKRPAMNESYVKLDRKLIPIRTLPIQGAQSIQGTQQIQRTQSVATMIWMCIIVLLCIGLTLTLIGWLRFSARNWNQFNSHKIEYKPRHKQGEIEESLIRIDSFTICDSLDANLINNSDIENDAPCKDDKSKEDEKTKKTVQPKIKNNSQHKTKNMLNRSGKDNNLYSETRCLTADDEQFDFSLQLNE